MDESFLKTLFSNHFMPHGHCYLWRPDVLWLNVLSDGLIALCYYAIPVVLLFFMYKRKDFPFPWVLAMFGAFILLCGTTHVMGIVTVWNPLYSLDGIIKAATALVSLLTTVMLVPLIPLALALKSPKELEAANLKLEDANEKLREIDRLKDNFFSNISHELRTPLTLILAPLESFLSNDYGTLTGEQRKNLEAMHNNSVRLFQMVNSILDFAKISAKKIEVKREPVDLVLLTQSITNEFMPIVRQKNIQINFTSAETQKIVEIDRYLYERILFNLLANATKFTPDNGSISVALVFEGDKITLSVTDTGIGISEEDQQKLFQRFQQVEGSATRRFEGTGLGLALVKEFALILGGDVTLQSEIGKGSKFIVVLNDTPATSAQAVVAKPLETRFQKYALPTTTQSEEEPGTLETTKLSKVLIAEDNLELATYISSLLSEFAKTKHARDGEEATEIIKTWEPDLVVLDVMMPKKDGLTVCREIKASANTAHIPVILLTALTHRDALLRGWEAGADEYLFKPFHPKELTTRIKLMLAYEHANSLVASLNRKLIVSARVAGMSEVATNLLHNLGNALNSVNVTANLLIEKLSKSSFKELDDLIDWMKATIANPEDFVKDKQKQADFVEYLNELNKVLMKEKQELFVDAESIGKFMRDIKEIIARQQKNDDLYGVIETVNLSALIDHMLTEHLDNAKDINVEKNYKPVVAVIVDKMRLQDILENLIINAKESLLESDWKDKTLTVSIKTEKDNGKEWIEIDIGDNGIGIPQENLNKIFNFGFSTKSADRGFGLHISHLSAKKMDGDLSVHSQGMDKGAVLTLMLPIEPLKRSKWVKI